MRWLAKHRSNSVFSGSLFWMSSRVSAFEYGRPNARTSQSAFTASVCSRTPRSGAGAKGCANPFWSVFIPGRDRGRRLTTAGSFFDDPRLQKPERTGYLQRAVSMARIGAG